jgi:hypothetical protein
MCSSGKSVIPYHSITLGGPESHILPLDRVLVLLYYLQLGVWENVQQLWSVDIWTAVSLMNFSGVFGYYLPKISDIFEFKTRLYLESFSLSELDIHSRKGVICLTAILLLL